MPIVVVLPPPTTGKAALWAGDRGKQTMAPEKRPTKEDTMRRTHRALAMLTLGLALVTATTAAAASPSTAPQDRTDQLARRAMYQSELDQNLQLRNRPGYERLVKDGLLSTKAAAEQARAMERNLTPVPAARAAAPPAARTNQAVPGQDMDVLATLLLGLVGGLVGGGAAMAGWTTATRRRTHRAATT